MLELTGREATLVGLSIWGGFSFEYLKAHEMGEVLLFEKHFGNVGPGPKIIPKGLFRLVRFPTLQIPITLQIHVVAAEANRADFYTAEGIIRKWSDLLESEREALQLDPLSHRSTVVVEVTALYEFVEKELYAFITRIGDFEKLGEQLGLAVKNALEGILSRTTISTILERKKELSLAFADRLKELVRESRDRPWGIRIVNSLIGPVALDSKVERQNAEASAAFATRIRLAQEGLGRADAVGSLAKYLQSEEGQLAGKLDIARQVYSGAEKVILSSGNTNPLVLANV